MGAEFKVFGDNENVTDKKPEKKKNKLIETFKKKPFLIAVVIVAFLGIWSMLRKSQTETTFVEDESGTITPDGLQLMYPSTDTYASSDASYVADALDTMVESFNDVIGNMEEEHSQQIDDLKQQQSDEIINLQDSFSSQLDSMQSAFDVQIDSMSTQLMSFSDKIDTQSDILTEQANEIAKKNAIQAMQNNSDAWHLTDDVSRKDDLHKANEKIASEFGWTYNSNDGYWYDGDAKVFTTATQSHYSSGVSASPASSNLNSKSADLAKMQQNSDAWFGASESERQRLSDENKAIAQKYGWTRDESTGYWLDSSGNRVYETETQKSSGMVVRNSSGQNIAGAPIVVRGNNR